MNETLKKFLESLPANQFQRSAAGGNQSLLLNGQDAIWVIESGHIDLFSAMRNNDGREGRRRHLTRLEEGACLFGCPPAGANAGMVFLAVGSLNTTLIAVPRSRFFSWLESSAGTAARESVLGPWIDQVTSGLLPRVPPRPSISLEAGKEAVIAGKDVTRCTKSIWFRVTEGGQRWLDIDLGGASDQVFFPLSMHGWLETDVPGKLQGLPLDGDLKAGMFAASLDGFFLKALAVADRVVTQEREKGEIRRTERKAQRTALDQEARQFILGRTDDDNEGISGSEPMLKAVQLIGKSMGVGIPELKPSALGNKFDISRLNEIAGHSRIRFRQVLLSGRWWEQECGPMLAVLEETKAPVALIPGKVSGYHLVSPVSGEVSNVNEALAAKLSPFGFVFYRSFPQKAMTFFEAYRFGLTGSEIDLSQILLMSLLTSALSMLMPCITGIIFDRAIPEASRSLLLEGFLCLVVTTLVTVFWQYAAVFPRLRLENRFSKDVQAGVIDRLLNLPTTFFRSFTSGDLATRAMSINSIRQQLGMSAMSGIQALVSVVSQLGLMFYYSKDLLLWVIGMGFANLFLLITLSLFYIRLLRQQTETRSKQTSFVLQTIYGIAKLKVAGAEGRAFHSWSEMFGTEKRTAYAAAFWHNMLVTFQVVFPTFSSAVIFYKGSSLLQSTGDPTVSVLTLGGFMAFSSASGIFCSSLNTIGQSFLSYMHVMPDIERMNPIFATIPEVQATKTDPGELSGQIDVARVNFRYSAESPQILHEVSLQAKPGEFVALVGGSGSGKSTLLRLLLGFETPESGSVQYDGHDLSDLAISSVRRQIGVVLQAGRLSAGSLYELIAGSSNYTLDDAWDAATQAGLREDIEDMPMQMHTMIGDGGTTLSGGQRQRLLIARALIKKPRIVFFDEATSALDNRTQAIVSESLSKMRATRVVIAHRLSTIQGADRIIVMHKGKIVESGKFQDLMALNGHFAALARRQLA